MQVPRYPGTVRDPSGANQNAPSVRIHDLTDSLVVFLHSASSMHITASNVPPFACDLCCSQKQVSPQAT